MTYNETFMTIFLLVLSYFYQLLYIGLKIDNCEHPGRIEIYLMLTPLSIFPIGVFYLIKYLLKTRSLPLKSTSEYPDETLEAIEIAMGMTFDRLPLYINNSNPIIRRFVQSKLK